ncbi:hypothetical protein AAC387_Pa11g1947 [Persea americana]
MRRPSHGASRRSLFRAKRSHLRTLTISEARWRTSCHVSLHALAPVKVSVNPYGKIDSMQPGLVGGSPDAAVAGGVSTVGLT